MPIFEKGRENKQPMVSTSPPKPKNIPSAPAVARPSATSQKLSANTAVIGATISITGQIVGSESLSVEGRIEGNIELLGNEVTVQQSGVVIAEVTAEKITVAGEARGDLNGREKVILKAGASVQGNIVAPRVTLEDGARFNGRIDMGSGENPRPAQKVKAPEINLDSKLEASKAN